MTRDWKGATAPLIINYCIHATSVRDAHGWFSSRLRLNLPRCLRMLRSGFAAAWRGLSTLPSHTCAFMYVSVCVARAAPGGRVMPRESSNPAFVAKVGEN